MKDAFGFGGFLPYESFDGGIFRNVDGSMGSAWALSRRPCELASKDELGDLAVKIAGLFRRLPEGAVCQFLLIADRELAGRFPPGAGEGLFGDLLRAAERSLRSMDLPVDGSAFRARSLASLFTLKLRPETVRAPAWLYLRSSGEFRARHEREDASRRAKLKALSRDVEDLFGQAGLEPARLDAIALRRTVARLLNPERGGDRMLQTHVDFDSRAGVWELDRIPHALLSVTELPGETWAGMLAKIVSLVPEGMVAVNLEIPEQLSIQRTLKAKKRLAFCQDRSGEADLASIRAEADGVLADMFARGVRVARARVHVWMRSRERLDEVCGAALNGLQAAGFGAVREGPLALSLALQCLPLAYDPANDDTLKRGRMLEDVNLAHLLPVYGAFPGTARGDLTLLNRLGEVVGFSFFEGDVAPHGIVCGVSGSGKSVLSNNLILHARRRGARVFVLDRGRSYEKIASVLGGRFVRFDGEAKRCLNPCGRELDPDKLVFLTDLFAEMATGGRGDLSLRERSLLSQALRQAFIEAQNEDVTVSHVCRALGRMDHPAAADLGLCLKLFTQGGPYGELFDGPGELDASADFVVFELERVALNKEIASVVLMAILQRITDACMRDPDVEKLLVVDEAWTLLQSPATARFLENVFRTYRKYRACAVMVTQQVSDFDGPAGAAIRANAPNRCYLRQTPETILAMEKLLDLKPPEKEALSTLRTLKGAFSEMLILTPRQSGIARLVQDPLTYWITTTDAEDNVELDALRSRLAERGDPDPLRAALQAASLRHPGGVQAARERRHG